MRTEGGFTLADFIAQASWVKRPGPKATALARELGLPPLDEAEVESHARRTRGIFDAMTAAEREAPGRLDAARRRRIARGAGVPVTEVSQFIQQFETSRDMMRRVGTMNSIRGVGAVLGLVTGDQLRRDPSHVHPLSGPTPRHLLTALAITLITLAVSGALCTVAQRLDKHFGQ